MSKSILYREMSQEVLIDNKKNDKPSYAQPLNEEEVSLMLFLVSLKNIFRSVIH